MTSPMGIGVRTIFIRCQLKVTKTKFHFPHSLQDFEYAFSYFSAIKGTYPIFIFKNGYVKYNFHF